MDSNYYYRIRLVVTKTVRFSRQSGIMTEDFQGSDIKNKFHLHAQNFHSR